MKPYIQYIENYTRVPAWIILCKISANNDTREYFVRASQNGFLVMASLATASSAASAPTGTLPNAVLTSLERSHARFLKHMNDETNADGNPWALEKKNNLVVVRGAQANDTSVRMFRVTFWIKTTNTGISKVLTDLMDMSKRTEWDSTIKSGVTKLGYDSGDKSKARYEVVEYTTNSVGGGIISPRWFLDARKTFEDADGTNFCVTTDGSDSGIASCPAGHVQAKNYEGSCSMFKRLQTDADGVILWRCENLAHCNINGYMPTWIVNRETGNAMMGTYTRLLEKLQKALGDGLTIVDPAEFL